ncbi:MAG: lipocalin family protein, partial [Victivallaceae bacterium]|nr:lipocalin family protein [Victivallaceae bacterium]
MKYHIPLLMLVLSLKILGCSNAGSTASIPAVNNFELGRYLGKWYEIARLPHSFERDMKDVYAEYGLREDGKISVINSGWRDGKKSVANGVAHPKNDPHTGELRVSFFRPFYGDYRIVWLEPDYSAAIVTGATTDYLWMVKDNFSIHGRATRKILLPNRETSFPRLTLSA